MVVERDESTRRALGRHRRGAVHHILSSNVNGPHEHLTRGSERRLHVEIIGHAAQGR